MIRVLLLLIFLTGILADGSSPEVTIGQGTLRGVYMKTRNGRNVAAFRGIPYAKPPIGDLRFRTSQPPDPWDGVLDATKDGSVCVQRFYVLTQNITGNEDCLFINVYSPQIPDSEKSRKPLDVMVWIHGGAWAFDSGSSVLYGPKFLLDKDIVLVAMNYRLGVFGFLSTEDDACPGNNGLKDQVAALRWVQNNIEAFGGNPNSVTLFGLSAGAGSVHYHVISPLSKGLFHRAISQSGTAVNIWSLSPPGIAKKHAKELATFLNCPTEPSVDLVSCLRDKEAYDIQNTDKDFVKWNFDPLIPFKPVVEKNVSESDDVFIPEEPLHYLLTSNTTLVPWIAGFDAQDGGFFTSNIFSKPLLIKQLNEDFDKIIPMAFYYEITAAPSDVKSITEKIRHFYFGKENITFASVFNATKMYSDSFFFSGINTAVKLHSQRKSKVYYYEFAYRGTNSYCTLLGLRENLGVCHEDEALYLFPMEETLFPGTNMSVNDNKAIDVMTTLWTNFAMTGNPTPEPSEYGIWNPVSSPDVLECARIYYDGVHMENSPDKKRSAFWDSLPLNLQTP